MSVRIDSYSGNFNWLNSEERSTIVRIFLPDDAPAKMLDESWPEGKEPDISMRPSEMVECIAERLKKYWINTEAEKKKEIIAWCRARSIRLDREWAQHKITSCERSIAEATKEIERLRRDYFEEVECQYCGTMSLDSDVPLTDAEWAAEAAHHAPDCKWIATKGETEQAA